MASSLREQFQRIIDQVLSKEAIEKTFSDELAGFMKNNPMYHVSSGDGKVTISSNASDGSDSTQGVSFIDLKQAFKQSSKAKEKKDGGWYLIVPIGIKARSLQLASYKDYKNITGTDVGTSSTFGDPGHFQEILQRETSSGLVNSSRYNWKSSGATRTPKGSGMGYTAFRTVSDKSDPTSWILAQQAQSNDNKEELDRGVMIQMQSIFQTALQKVQNQSNL